MSVQSDTSRVQYPGNGSTSTPYPIDFPFFNDSDLVVQVTNSVDGTSVVISNIVVTGLIVTITTSGTHGISHSDIVSIRGIETKGYNLEFATVTSVPSSTTFTYSVSAAPAASPGIVASGAVIRNPADAPPVTLTLNADYTVTGAGNANDRYIVTPHTGYANTYLITIYRKITATQLTEYEASGKFPAKSHETALDKLTMLMQQCLRSIARCIRVGDTDNELEAAHAIANTIPILNGNKEMKLLTPAELAVFLNLPSGNPLFGAGIKAFSGSNAGVSPDYPGQLGIRTDTKQLYIATGTNAGNWTEYLVFGISPNSTSGIITAAMLSSTQSEQIAILDKISKQSANIASASTINLNNATGDLVDVTGTTAITAITLDQGKTRTVRFTGALTLTNGANLILPGGANITTAAGDFAIFRGYGSSVVRCASYNKASGQALTFYSPASGAILQSVSSQYTANANLATNIPYDNTTPLIAEGDELSSLNLSITPTSSSNKIRVRFSGTGGVSVANYMLTVTIWRGTTLVGVTAQGSPAAAAVVCLNLLAEDAPNTTSPVAYTVRAGSNLGTARMNGDTAGQKYNGSTACTLILEEIKA